MLSVVSRRSLIFVLVALLVACTVTVQPEWKRLYNGGGSDRMNWMSTVTVDSRGDVVMVGSSLKLGGGRNEDMVIAKYDPQGNRLWVRAHDLSTSLLTSDEDPKATVIDEAGNIYIAGVQYLYDDNTSLYASFVMKVTSTGQVAWSRKLSDVQDAYNLKWQSGRLYVTGQTTQVFDTDGKKLLNIAHTSRPAWAIDTNINGEFVIAGSGGISRYSANGTLVWHQPAQAGVQHQADIIFHEDGTMTVAQMLQERGAARISHLAADGRTVWRRDYATPKRTFGMAGHAMLAEDGRGDLYLVSSNTDARRLVKINRAGREYWNKTNTKGIVTAMDVSPSGGLFIVGNGNNEKWDSSGKLLAEAPAGGTVSETTGALARDGDSIYVGYSIVNNSTYEFYLAKYKDQE
jgi:hypothetical protein